MFLQQVGMLWGGPSVQMWGGEWQLPQCGETQGRAPHLRHLLVTSGILHLTLPDRRSLG